MSAQAYFRIGLAFPLVGPALVLLFHVVLSDPSQSTFVAALAYQIAYGAPGYLLFVPFVLYLARDKTPKRLINLALLSPLAFIPFCAASFWFVSMLLGISLESVTLAGFVRFLPFVALYCVVFGYAYVFIALVGYLLMSHTIAQAPTPANVRSVASRHQDPE